jgi:hypothetical protein
MARRLVGRIARRGSLACNELRHLVLDEIGTFEISFLSV